MHWFNCPHCGRPTFSAVHKLTLALFGVLFTVKCAMCGRRVGTPVVQTVLADAALVMGAVLDARLGISALLIGAAAWFYIGLRWVPLIRKTWWQFWR